MRTAHITEVISFFRYDSHVDSVPSPGRPDPIRPPPHPPMPLAPPWKFSGYASGYMDHRWLLPLPSCFCLFFICLSLISAFLAFSWEYFSYSASWAAVSRGRHVISSGADSRGGLHKNREKTSLRVRTLLFQESRVADSLKVGTIYSILKNINVVEYKRTNDQHTYRYLLYIISVAYPDRW